MNLKSFLVIFCAILAMSFGCADKAKPKLLVFISVDQMRGDFLPLFNDQLEHGFRTLQTGHSWLEMHHDHSNTVTAAGHATLVTGFYPSNNGIVGNHVYNRLEKRNHYSIEDSTVNIIGVDSCNLNGVSVRNLKKKSIGDIIKEANPTSRSFSVALKDRASIIMGGHECNRAYWFDAQSTQMVSSDYYEGSFPTWVQAFKASDKMRKEIDGGWLKEADFEIIDDFTSIDSFPQETDRFYPNFPHTKADFKLAIKEDDIDGNMIWHTPLGDQYVLKFAKELIAQEKLGKGNATDVLTVGLSCADVIGHQFGPNSHEILDYYNKLDIYLDDFISYLNTTVGEGNYVLALTSDHGINAMPEVENEEGAKMRISHGQFDTDIALVDQTVKMHFKLSSSCIMEASYKGVEPDLSELAKKGIDSSDFIQFLTEQLKNIPYIHEAYSLNDIINVECDKPFIDMVRRSYDSRYGYMIRFVPKANYLVDFRDNGTTHGTPYRYDTHVPFILYAHGITKKVDDSQCATVDIVPTLLEHLEIPTEEDFDGKSLL